MGQTTKQPAVPATGNGEAAATLGARLRHRRLEMGLRLKEVAEQAGFSVGFISQIERDITTPSLTSLIAVARVLEHDVRDFLLQPRGDNAMTRQDERVVYGLKDGALRYERLSASFPGNVLSSVIIHEPPGHRDEPVAHEGEEIFFILEGAITVEIDGEVTVLHAGDSIHFPSTKRHATWNHTSAPTTILHTCTMDVFGDNIDAVDEQRAMDVIRHGKKRKSGNTQNDKGNKT